MSKAFTRESDSPAEVFSPSRAPLPPGTRNYITSEGAQKVRADLKKLIEAKQTLSPESPDRSSLEARLQHLQALVSSFAVVESTQSDIVRFGSTVTLSRDGVEEIFRIVGVDEIDLDRNYISWLSPLARALTGRRAGERVQFQAPSGRQELKIIAVG